MRPGAQGQSTRRRVNLVTYPSLAHRSHYSRDRSNRLLEGRVMPSTKLAACLRCNAASKRRSLTNASQHRSKTDADQSVPPTEHIQPAKSARWRNEGSEARHAYWPTAHRCHHVRAPRSSREPQLCKSGRHQLATAAPPTEAMRQNSYGPNRGHLTMRLSDAGLHRRQTKALYPNHRSSPWLAEDATRDRSNRLLGACPEFKPCVFVPTIVHVIQFERPVLPESDDVLSWASWSSMLWNRNRTIVATLEVHRNDGPPSRIDYASYK